MPVRVFHASLSRTHRLILCPINAAQACPELSQRALLPARRRQVVGGACPLPAPLPFVLTPLVAHPGTCPACPGLAGTWSEGVRPFLPSSFDFRLASTPQIPRDPFSPRYHRHSRLLRPGWCCGTQRSEESLLARPSHWHFLTRRSPFLLPEGHPISSRAITPATKQGIK